MKWEKIIIILLIFGYVNLNLRLKSTQYQMTEFMKKGHPIYNNPKWVATHGKPGPPGHCQPGPTGTKGPIGKRGPLSTRPDDWDDELDGEWMEMTEFVNVINHLKHVVASLKSPKKDVDSKINFLMEKNMLLMNNIADINNRIRKGGSSGQARRSVDFMIKQAADAASKILNLESKIKTGTGDSTVINYIDSRLLKLNKAIKDSDFDARSFMVKELRSLENAMSERLDKISVPGVDGRDGPMGAMGAMGAMGPKGPKGDNGKDGIPGECPFPVWQITQILDKRLKEKISFNN